MRMIKPWALVALGLVALSACASQPAVEKEAGLIFTAADSASSKTLKIGQSFDVRLLGTPTAGYLWDIQSLPAGVVLVDKTSRPENPEGRKQGMVGGNDWTIFRFQTISAPVDLQGTAGQSLVLRYGRPWELEAGRPAEQIWRMQIAVKPAG